MLGDSRNGSVAPNAGHGKWFHVGEEPHAESGDPPGVNRDGHMPQRKAAVCTGWSQSPSISSSIRTTVIEQPAMSSEVT
jgi:hypothetical protein